MNKLRNIVIILLIFFMIILGFLSYVFIKNLRAQNEKDYVAEFTTMASNIYSEYYYKITAVNKTEEQLNDYLSKFSSKGLKFDLKQMEKYNDEYKQTISDFSEKYKDCKKDEVIVIIYPKSPYTNTDFTTEMLMSCDYTKNTR